MTNTTITKNVVKSVSSQLAKKASSWKQVAKQLSGLTGKIKLSATESVDIHTALKILGVCVKGASVTAHDLNNAWSEKLKAACPQFEGEDRPANSDWRCPLISKPLTATLKVGADNKEHKAYSYDAEAKEYVPIKVNVLCRVVKGEAKTKKTDVVVSAKIVCEGLAQSVYVEDTLAEVEATQTAWANTKRCFVNVGSASAPVWRAVEVDGGGIWHFEITAAEQAAIKRKAAEQAAIRRKAAKSNVVSVDVTTK